MRLVISIVRNRSAKPQAEDERLMNRTPDVGIYAPPVGASSGPMPIVVNCPNG
jgi:hypothetical protein